ncbi:MAG: hypothetical protein JNL74_10000 [Fibrobacteres bacterium]|nr:hypothetical protein [Fibrobacterota bacterium]
MDIDIPTFIKARDENAWTELTKEEIRFILTHNWTGLKQPYSCSPNDREQAKCHLARLSNKGFCGLPYMLPCLNGNKLKFINSNNECNDKLFESLNDFDRAITFDFFWKKIEVCVSCIANDSNKISYLKWLLLKARLRLTQLNKMISDRAIGIKSGMLNVFSFPDFENVDSPVHEKTNLDKFIHLEMNYVNETIMNIEFMLSDFSITKPKSVLSNPPIQALNKNDYDHPYTVKQIAEEFKCNSSTVYKVIENEKESGTLLIAKINTKYGLKKKEIKRLTEIFASRRNPKMKRK